MQEPLPLKAFPYTYYPIDLLSRYFGEAIYHPTYLSGIAKLERLNPFAS